MSLYFEAATVLSGPSNAGSLKSRIYTGQWKSPPAQIYALVVEAAKYDGFIKQVVDAAGLLSHEPKLTPLLSLLLVHDFLLSKRGIAAPSSHPLRLAVERHKTRLNAEFTKLRVRRGCASKEELKRSLLQDQRTSQAFSPRWIRINNALTTLAQELETTFSTYSPVDSLAELAADSDSDSDRKRYYLDEHIPDLLAIGPDSDIISTPSYKEGRLILQDKASCFPAYLLLGDNPEQWSGDIIDGCAAPGNKTTHLASLLSSRRKSDGQQKNRIFSLDASHSRSKILQEMVKKAGVKDRVTVLPGQDFLALDPKDRRFQQVTALLLDPSCSGSGITKRENIPQLALPKSKSELASTNASSRPKNKKRKRGDETGPTAAPAPASSSDNTADSARLTKLANLQSQIIEHAFRFPAATRVTYSTCSIHRQENEGVVAHVLASSIARRRGWRVEARADQASGLHKWHHRGVAPTSDTPGDEETLSPEDTEACVRCWPEDEDGTGGFFVAAFVRDADAGEDEEDEGEEEYDEEVWEGCSSS
ncbi:uncharacterized protein GIQ15_03800 [Arthroderma uncinatum]|uniref:uncharacterized protein n=1 Tax=Arthroderma uncinatum TaxID=74035 RepID=UPI00144AAB4F|nr:uncharacterized protein GIQ15_03800 [Arthroderma uncinatum]KAF3481041.1 hypothetical protein GIQ15_03800 [Arthroderma uncinatum]